MALEVTQESIINEVMEAVAEVGNDKEDVEEKEEDDKMMLDKRRIVIRDAKKKFERGGKQEHSDRNEENG